MPHRAYRYRFYPNREQEFLLRKTIGCVRFVYNKILEARATAWSERKERIRYAASDKLLTAWKRVPETAFLGEVASRPLQDAVRRVDAAFKAFFEKRTRHPAFKRKRHGGSATYSREGFYLRGDFMRLSRIPGRLDVRWSRKLPEGVVPSSVTVTLDAAGRWHLVLRCVVNIEPLPPVAGAIGIDLGLEHFATMSTGEKEANPRFQKALRAKRRRLAQSVSRKQKGSRNREKARRALARHDARAADRRKDHLHKLSTRLVRENQTIVVENLNVAGMVRNKKLARSIYDAGWATFVSRLEYKCQWYGRELVKIGRYFPSSKTCRACGSRVEALGLAEREWACAACGVVHDRDMNAAMNILAAGQAVTACGPSVSHRISDPVQPGMKQELQA